MSEDHPYRDLFMITLAMQCLATGPFWVLLFLVPRKEVSVQEVAAEEPSSERELKTEGERTEPEDHGGEEETDPLLK